MSELEKTELLKELIDLCSEKKHKGVWGNIPEWIKIMVMVAIAGMGAYLGTQKGLASLEIQISTLNASFSAYKEADSRGADAREIRIGRCENNISDLNGRVKVNESQIGDLKQKGK